MTDIEDLLHQIEIEAEQEGPAGQIHLNELRDRFDLVVQIIDRRRELHLTQQQVAAASGLHQSVVSRIEQGVANPTARTLAALARALDARLTLTGRWGGAPGNREAFTVLTQDISCDPAVMMGKPVVGNSRITVESILEELGGGQSIEQLLEAHPRLTREGVLAALRFGAEVLRADVASGSREA